MCGIGGIIKVTPAGGAGEAAAALVRSPREAIPEAWLDVLDESIRHRGPDGQGRFRDRVVRADGSVVDVALVHRRLSIIDHGGGAQPMVSVRRGGAERARSAGSPKPGPHARGAMTPLLFHGKPDAAVVYEGMREAEAQERLVDRAVAGEDPELALGAPSDVVAVVFNGCIYNHRELRRELLAAGHEFRTDHSDTEVLLHGWREWGVGLQEKLDGMYAIVMWDRLTGSLVVMRDRFGEKPVNTFHSKRGGAWYNVFSSVPAECTRLARAMGENEEPFEQGTPLREWLRFGYGPDPPLRRSRSLQPAMGAIYGPERRARWSRAIARDEHGDPGAWGIQWPSSIGRDGKICRSGALTPERADELVRRAVESRLEADVPLACFLSGGIDSSLVALHACKATGDLRTFTVRMPDARMDESSVAAEVARIAGTDHVTLDCDPRPAEDLVTTVRQIGLPFGDSSLLPTLWVSRAAAAHVGVALSGDGGDELFAGYERYRWANTTKAWLPGIGSVGWMLEWFAASGSRRTKLARLLRAATHDGYLELLSIFPTWHLRRLVAGVAEGPLDAIRSRGVKINSTVWAIESDLRSYLPNDLLRKVDSASMACALEVRCPMLERELARSCAAATLDSLMPRGQRKGLLRQVARKYFPPEIVDRPKQGFAIPIGEWFRTDYGGMRQLLMDHLESTEPWGPPRLGIELNMKFVRQMMDEHMNERRDHSQRLYMLLVLSIWAKWMGSLEG